ncbi:MAG: hypothetical protein H6823_09540 [Planctomycetaceae bacterium]|nr:hypothetical protein [Planctomycetaceae bacterium]
MPFDIDKLFAHCKAQIRQFAREHTGERFYAFAIDADMLCLNSDEEFTRTLNEYQSRWDRQTRTIDSLGDMTEEDMRDEEFGLGLAEKYSGLDRSDEKAVLEVINERRADRRSEGCKYRTEEAVKELRANTGDWAYQGFADMEDDNGFDSELYNDHYYAAMDSDDGHTSHTEYALAMTELVDRLRLSDAFDNLKRTDDFVVSWVDHSY